MALLKKRLAEAKETAAAAAASNVTKEEAMGDVRAISAEFMAAKSREQQAVMAERHAEVGVVQVDTLLIHPLNLKATGFNKPLNIKPCFKTWLSNATLARTTPRPPRSRATRAKPRTTRAIKSSACSTSSKRRSRR